MGPKSNEDKTKQKEPVKGPDMTQWPQWLSCEHEAMSWTPGIVTEHELACLMQSTCASTPTNAFVVTGEHHKMSVQAAGPGPEGGHVCVRSPPPHPRIQPESA